MRERPAVRTRESFPPPKNGTHYKTVLVGGPADVMRDVSRNLARERSVEIWDHFEKPTKLVRGVINPAVDFVIVLSEFTSKSIRTKLIKDAKEAGVPLICSNRKWVSMQRVLDMAGLPERPPVIPSKRVVDRTFAEPLRPISEPIVARVAEASRVLSAPPVTVSAEEEEQELRILAEQIARLEEEEALARFSANARHYLPIAGSPPDVPPVLAELPTKRQEVAVDRATALRNQKLASLVTARAVLAENRRTRKLRGEPLSAPARLPELSREQHEAIREFLRGRVAAFTTAQLLFEGLGYSADAPPPVLFKRAVTAFLRAQGWRYAHFRSNDVPRRRTWGWSRSREAAFPERPAESFSRVEKHESRHTPGVMDLARALGQAMKRENIQAIHILVSGGKARIEIEE